MYKQLLTGEKHGLSKADTSPNIDTFANASYLIAKDEVVIDIDDVSRETIEKIISFFNVKSEVRFTTRGAHFYFNVPETVKKRLPLQKVCNIGFFVEYKKKECVIKQENKEREVINRGVRLPLPDFFKPNKNLQNLSGMDDGEGRNNSLFLAWQKVNNPMFITFINNHVFAEPLPQSEVDQILASDKNVKDFDFRDLAEEFIEENAIVKYNNNLYCKHRGEWLSEEAVLKGQISQYFTSFKMKDINEIYSFCEILIENTTQEEYPIIKLDNGIINRGKFYETNYEDFTPFTIKRKYDKKSTPNDELIQLFDLLFKDSKTQNFFFEFIGFSLCLDLIKRKKSPLVVFLYGKGGDGKSTLLSLIRDTIGLEYFSATKVQNLDNYKELSSLDTKLLNFGEDIENTPIKNEAMATLKNISALDRINVNAIYKETKTTILFPQLLFTTNHLIKTFEKGASVERRVKFIDFTSDLRDLVDSEKIEIDFFEKLNVYENKNYILKLMVEGCERVLKKGYTKSKKVEEFTNSWNDLNDFTKKWILDLDDVEINLVKPQHLYIKYCSFCEDEDSKPRTKKTFIEEVNVLRGYEYKVSFINKKAERVFVKKETNG